MAAGATVTAHVENLDIFPSSSSSSGSYCVNISVLNH